MEQTVFYWQMYKNYVYVSYYYFLVLCVFHQLCHLRKM